MQTCRLAGPFIPAHQPAEFRRVDCAKPLDIAEEYYNINKFKDRRTAVYAIIKTGGKQYRVAPGDVLRVERLPGIRGDEVVLDQVLLVTDGEDIRVGQPVVANATVRGQIVRQGQAKKILVFKKKRRKGYRRTQGHRQLFTALEIKEITL